MSRRQRMRSIWASALAVGLMTAAGLWLAPAFACTVLADIQTKPGRGVPGALIRVEGSGFELHGNPVQIYWGGQGHGALLATAADVDGRFSVDVTIPLNAVANSEYLIEAFQDGSPTHTGLTLFRVPAQAPLAAPSPPVAPAQGPGPVQAPVTAPAPGAAQPQPAGVARPAPVQQPVSTPTDASGFSAAGTPAFASDGQPVAPVNPGDGRFGGGDRSGGGPSPWILLPLGVIGMGLFAHGGAAAVRQVKREAARARI